MTVDVKPYILGGDAENGPEGKQSRHVYLVSGLESAPAAHFFDAIKRSEIPRIGQPHPTEAGLFCYRQRARLGGTTDKHDTVVECLFGPRERLTTGAKSPLGSVRSSLRAELVTEETIRDVDGKLMQTTYISRLRLTQQGSSITVSTISHRVSVQKPSFSLVFTRVESALPVALAFRFAGTTNSGTYRGQKADAWLCNVESEDQGDGTFSTTYTLTLNRSVQGWQALIRHSVDGQVPLDTQLGRGEEIRQVYPRQNFGGLPV